ncbi:unnamed protein product [Adineta steineri]|uniref:Uncharacterized protein n=1 Tax=Adineta steineri TaxID=433720 RepID=A0A813UTD7_9BILA|nr:unnamed protein product [Adineta steineri]
MAVNLFDIQSNLQSLSINDEWSCSKCSFNNPLMAYPCCEMCEQVDSRLLQGFSITNQSVPTWECSRCTLKNLTISEQCTACGESKSKSNKNETTLVNSSTSLSQTCTSLSVRNRRHRDESDAENIFQHIITYCRENKTHFVDDQFVPSDRSIGTGSFDNISQWLRISDVAPLPDDPPNLPWTIFSSPQPSDIQQGALGNCWLIAALALISERPRLLEHILLTKQVNSQGVYLVRICHNGLWKTIIVDDCFPCTKHKRLVFTQAKRQGALGNCWLIAALALISERPRLLEHILLTKQVNSQGVYLVRICHNGLWKTIIVDDCFPCTKHKRLVFTQAKRRQLYVPLIEKACAKLFGSYSSLKSGNMLEGLQLLTGAACDHINLKPSKHPLESDIVWVKLLSACESKLLIGTSTSGTNVNRDEYAAVHIHSNHAFSILAAHALVNDTSRFVLVRDPHSRSQYREDSITESVLKQLRLINSARRSTGAFWISWPRFLHFFESITISTYNSDHFDIRQQGQFTQSSTEVIKSYFFDVPQTSSINISLLYHRHNRKARSYHTQSFVLCDIEKSASTTVVGKHYSKLISKRERFTYWEGSLRAGSYVLIPFTTSFWGTNEKNRDYTVVIHSSVQLDLTTENKRPTFLADCLIAAVMRGSNKQQKEKEAAFYTPSKDSAMLVFIAENLSTKNYLSVEVSMNIARCIHHSRYSQLPYNTHDYIPPRYRQVIFITEWTHKRNESAQLSYSYLHRFSTQTSDSIPTINTFKHDLHSPRAF